jgi:ferredoxin
MDADLQTQLAFCLTGKTPGSASGALGVIDGLHLRPALLAGYHDLTQLRYDFPLVLRQDLADASFAEPLSALVDAALGQVAQGPDGPRIRQHALRLEAGIRSLLATGVRGSLAALWDQAAAQWAPEALMADSLARIRPHLPADGELLDCDAALPFALLGHAWASGQSRRAVAFIADIARLMLKLSDILDAEFANSDAGKTPERLRAAFGSGPMDSFDFEVMSRLLSQAARKNALPKARRERVSALLGVLSAQRFFASADAAPQQTHGFVFDTCAGALAAYRARLPELIVLAKAVALAELEIHGNYHEARHETLFAAWGDNGLEAQELARFPDYLVRLKLDQFSAEEQGALGEILALDLPVKILLQIDDVTEPSPLVQGQLAFVQRSRQLASMAMGLNTVFVLQAPASSLAQLRPQIRRGLDFAGPALFCLFSGAQASSAQLPPYLVGAAALASRVFPVFVFDPSAGVDWATRFSLDGNPQPERDWPLHELAFEDERQQAVSETLAFTLIDFVAGDARFSRHFAAVPRARWQAGMVPVASLVADAGRGPDGQLPSVWMLDPGQQLHKLIVDNKLMREARRCASLWRNLQELAGIHNSHARRLLTQERAQWLAAAALQDAARAAGQASATAAAVEPAAATAAPAEAAPAPEEAAPVRSPDEAYIETERCSTCNACEQINPRMFVYNANRQATLADITAGTYAQLVEAAENCQLAIIHPGKPHNPREAGLPELIQRAAAFQ